VAASILGALLVAGYMVASPAGSGGSLPEFALNAVVLAAAFWFPARRIGSLGELRSQWRAVLVWLVAWTLVWDLATAGVLAERALFSEWWIVYPAGVLGLGGLLVLHAAVVGRLEG
jgi:hypothetical protein